MRKEITICGASLTAEGVDKADLQADEDSAKWYAEKTGFDLSKLMQQAGWVTAHRHLIEDINKAVGGKVFPTLVPSKDYAEKEKAAMDSGIGVKRLKPAAERVKEILSLSEDELHKIEKAVTSGKSEEEMKEVFKECGIDVDALPRGILKMDTESFKRFTKELESDSDDEEDIEEALEEDDDDEYDEDYDDEEDSVF